jgi:hypothetical protein
MADALLAAIKGGDYYKSPWYNWGVLRLEKVGQRNTYATEEYAWSAELGDKGWRPGTPRTNGDPDQVSTHEDYKPGENLVPDVTKIVNGKVKVGHNHPPGGDPYIMSGYGLHGDQKPIGAGDKGEAIYYSSKDYVNGREVEVGNFYMVDPSGRLHVGNSVGMEDASATLQGKDFLDLVNCLRCKYGIK